MAKRIGGIITFKVDGTQYAAKGNFTYNIGVPKREGVIAADGKVAGYKETPTVPFIEGEITDQYDVDLKQLTQISDATVTLDMPTGKSIILRGAWYAGDGTGNTEEGNFPVRFEGTDAEEVK